MMILAPDWIDRAAFEAAVAQVSRAKVAPRRLSDVRFESLAEGRCLQTLHRGSYDDEAPTLAYMHDDFIPSHGLRMTGTHHEVRGGTRRAPQAVCISVTCAPHWSPGCLRAAPAGDS